LKSSPVVVSLLRVIPAKFGRYEVIEEIGRGSMGVVYRARDPFIDRDVAIKTVPMGYSLDSDRRASHLERLRREALAAGRLNHPNIVVVYDVGEEGESFYIAMELLKGRTLDRAIKESRIFSLEESADIIAEVASALDHAHSKEVIHRDIKPSNLFLLEDGGIKITDFGIAKLPLGTLTGEGRIVGSPSYMSPEQVRGERVGPRSDVFSLGVVLYIILTGKKPYGGGEVPEIVYRIVHEEPPPPSAFKPELSPEVDKVVAKALAKDPVKRFQSAGELAKAYRKAIRRAGNEEIKKDEGTDSSTGELKRHSFDMERYREKNATGCSNIERVFQEITSEYRSLKLDGKKKKRKKRK